MEAGYSNHPSATASTRWTSVVSAVEKVHALTEQLFQLVSQSFGKDQRDDRIEKINSLIEQRELILPDIHPPFSIKEKELFQQVVQWNEVIVKKMAEIKQLIQQDMIQLKKTKTSNQQYVNPYQNISTSDGMFYDKRK